MKLSQGNGGWFCLEDVDDFPGPLYFRMEVVDGRPRITELYADGQGRPLSAAGFRSLPLRQLEQWAADFPNRSRWSLVGPDLSRLASHFASSFGSRVQGWVADSMRAQVEGSGIEQSARGRRPQGSTPPTPTVRIDAPTTGRLTSSDRGCVRPRHVLEELVGESPGVAVAESASVPLRTAQRWFYTARKRGLMPPATGPGRIV
jgi:hypothetical protein